MAGASIETTLELWVSSLRSVAALRRISTSRDLDGCATISSGKPSCCSGTCTPTATACRTTMSKHTCGSNSWAVDALSMCDEVAHRMTPAQISEVQATRAANAAQGHAVLVGELCREGLGVN